MLQPVQAARAVAQGMVVAIADFKAFYTWRTWLGAWLVRIVCQVAFYSMIGHMVGDSDYVVFVIIGAAMMACVAETLMTSASSTWDRTTAGTLPLLVGSPVEPGFFYFGRSVMWPLSATVTTSVAILTLSFFFDLSWTPVQIVLLLLLVLLASLSTYCFALVVGSFAMLYPGARNVMSAVVTVWVSCFCGTVVPVDFWPPAVQWAAQTIPMTHGLEAVRGLEGGAPAAEVTVHTARTLLSGAAWFLLSLLLFRRNFSAARRGNALVG
ncbi:hypothetical protein BJF83_16665 [Nocardiopsis sp. CNR-923]|uniref:ABC transporter permease n=1 Tax=Nocardiopsis sp. CNR-923 TaxID=1904965 RepID=UPI000964B72E|nr:ABC transporter permease [Nocardiopsis sp. CNR-923]OLT27955.1 hypothetical protein BJF83_16665 [Nocardiopsis sp. CNR-923]